ncbi:hypothetical protein [Desulfonatronum thiosulfatophilum]|uniref:hypothetical protein n=1 Tax=Desulfonatronum thiosulfatophilum TaxID=617002 RepID=UPI000B8532CE|nr:hypothetical protein [Desulfonatronum thiosulfatophilum]
MENYQRGMAKKYPPPDMRKVDFETRFSKKKGTTQLTPVKADWIPAFAGMTDPETALKMQVIPAKAGIQVMLATFY